MAQSTILASGAGSGTSSDVAVTAGTFVRVGIFVSSGDIPTTASATVMIDTPGADVVLEGLTKGKPIYVFQGPGTIRVVRPAQATAIGIFSET